MLGCPGPPEPGAGRLRICERTKLLVLEINTVSCCSRETGMAAGCRPAVPWTYRSVAGEYAYLEKRFVAELGPPRPPAEPPVPPGPRRPRVLQDSANHPPAGCQLWGWGLPGAVAPQPAVTPGGRPGPPSYEAHMQRVAQARRPGPPPYVSPPAYDAPHRTLRPPAPRRSPPAPRGPGAAPARCSYTLPRAAAEARPRPPPPGWGRSQTLPRAAAVAWGREGPRRAPAGHFVIDATRVVIRAEYVPPPRREQVRYLGGRPAAPPEPGEPPARPPGAGEAAAASLPAGSPRRGAAGSPGGRLQQRQPPYARRPALYAQDLREAVSRIRRHTAPDSDSEAEGRGPRGAGGWRHCREALAYSSSSSSSLEGAGAAACA